LEKYSTAKIIIRTLDLRRLNITVAVIGYTTLFCHCLEYYPESRPTMTMFIALEVS